MDDLRIFKPRTNAHWYLGDGKTCHTVIGANGAERNTTLRDARKMNLYPSVTSLIGDVLVNRGLNIWMQNIILEASYTVPRQDVEDWPAYGARVRADAEEFGKVAREFGSGVHAEIDQFNRNMIAHNIHEAHGDTAPWIENYREWFDENIVEVISSEETVVNHDHSYAGTMDLVAIHATHGKVVIDFKTQKFKKGKPNFYDSWNYQLAAYRECVDDKPPCLNVVIDSNEPSAPVEKLWTAQETKRGWDIFRRAAEIWQLQKNYYPEAGI
jgi:hypothetical protein